MTELPKRGDVILVPFPNSDLRTSKMRPALVVQSNKIETDLNQLVVAMISSNMSRAGRGPRVIIEPDESTGLLLESVVMTDNLATIHVHQVLRVIGHLEQMGSIDKALRHTLDL